MQFFYYCEVTGFLEILWTVKEDLNSYKWDLSLHSSKQDGWNYKFPGRMLFLCAYLRLADIVHNLGNILCAENDPSYLVSVVAWSMHHVWETSEQPKVLEQDIPCNHVCSLIEIHLLWGVSDFQWINRLPSASLPSFSSKLPPKSFWCCEGWWIFVKETKLKW